jgi:hypothetical protein
VSVTHTHTHARARTLTQISCSTGALFVQASKQVRLYSEQLLPILEELLSSEPALRTVVLDVLSGSSSDAALQLLWGILFYAPAVTRAEQQRVLMNMAHLPKPSALAMSLVYDLLSDKSADEQVRITATLALGAMVRKVRLAGSAAPPGSEELAQRAVATMTQMLREETDTFLKTLYIAALGNAGDASALPYMMEYITTNQDRDLRLMAIKSVRLMPRGDPQTERARELVVRAYLNTDNDNLVRSLAFRTISDHAPRESELTAMVHAAKWERNLEIARYVRSHLKSLSETEPEPQLRRLARGLLDDLRDAGVVVDFSGTNLTQLSLRLGFEKVSQFIPITVLCLSLQLTSPPAQDEEYFFIGDNRWGIRYATIATPPARVAALKLAFPPVLDTMSRTLPRSSSLSPAASRWRLS